MKPFIIKADPFPFDVLFGVDISKKKFLQYIKKRYKISQEDEKNINFSEDNGVQEARTILLTGGQIIVWLEYVPKDPFTIGLLAHECTHVTQFLFDMVNIDYCESNFELWAYQQQFFVEKVISRCYN